MSDSETPRVELHGDVQVLVMERGCRPATSAEATFYAALVAARAELSAQTKLTERAVEERGAALARLAEIDAAAKADAADLAVMRDGTKLSRAGLVSAIVYLQQDLKAAERLLQQYGEGWVAVPREPTYDMVQAGAKLVKDNLPYHTGTKAIYETMIAAAPPASQDEPIRKVR